MEQATTGNPSVVRGSVLEQGNGTLVLAFPGSDYRLQMVIANPVTPDASGKVSGRILARAKRVDVVTSGGRFVEPVYGRPRRVQGRVAAIDTAKNTITVTAGVAITVELTDPRQKAEQFAPGTFVGFDVEKGARFEPQA